MSAPPGPQRAGGNEITVEAVSTADSELINAITRLVPQLSSSARLPTAYEIERIVESSATTLFVARDADLQIVGTLTLVVFRAPTGVRAWIEDVVVETSARGRGVGAALVEAAVAGAELAEARTVDLTSRSGRTEANLLYQRLGFERRETNVYRRTLEPAQR